MLPKIKMAFNGLSADILSTRIWASVYTVKHKEEERSEKNRKNGE